MLGPVSGVCSLRRHQGVGTLVSIVIDLEVRCRKTPSVGCRISVHHKCKDNSGGVEKMMIDSEARKRRTQGTLSDNDRKGFKAHHKCGHNSGGGPRNLKRSKKED